jgi:hypothetical protein
MLVSLPWCDVTSQTLTGNSIVESLLSQVACLIRRVENLVVEHGEVERKAQANRVGGCEISGCNFSSILVRLKRLIRGLLALVANSEFGEVSVVVTLPVVKRVSDCQTSC